ncbi:sensor histidine kinase [Cohnella mopanensis]|uniref:sensor histidine kinase n=1 Tax=Cohnella mopanensis TaxID=2911966 RepID=UPI001EF7D5B9|nr:sensor histidine kinase [Cohnella mopanensis]
MLRKVFHSLLIRQKIIVVFIPLIIVPLFILGYFTSDLFTNSLVEKTKQNVINESTLILTRLDTMIKNAEGGANVMMTDINHIYSSLPDISNPLQEKMLNSQMQTQFSISLLNFPDIDSAAYIDSSNQLFVSYSPIKDNDKMILESDLVKQVNEKPGYGMNYWYPMEYRDYIVSKYDEPVLSIGKKVLQLESGLPFGTLIVNLKESSISNIFANVNAEFGIGSKFVILDSEGRVISSLDKGELLFPLKDEPLRELVLSKGSFSQIMDTDTGNNLITSVMYEKMGWRLVNIVPVNQITEDIKKNGMLTLLIGAICLLVASLGAGMLSKVIVNPLIKLTKAMRRVKEGDLNTVAPIDTPDETGLMASVFNSMVTRIKELLLQVEADQIKKKEIELALIHSQIKPHFLYNTLDLIYVLNDMNKQHEARDATKALADFYRVALSKGSEIISIGEELKNACDYLAIQSIRYSDVFEFKLQVDHEIYSYEIPKLTLQPILENAIYHGLKLKDNKGSIWITGYKEDNFIFIHIEDDGVGIAEDKQENIRRQYSYHDKPASFGLFSVHERIRLYFGEAYGISIESIEGTGTKVTVKVPAGGRDTIV